MRQRPRGWAREKRTGLELLKDWIEREGGPTRAADLLGVSQQRLQNFLRERKRGVRPEFARDIARAAGIPVEAVLFKNEPVRDAIRGCPLLGAA